MRKTLRRVISHAVRLYKLRILRDSLTVTVDKWFTDNGDATLRLEYPLTGNSIVFDVGGYKGEWSTEIANRYNPYIFIFEPVPKYSYAIVTKFSSNTKVKVYNFGLSDRDAIEKMSLREDGSSCHSAGKNQIDVALRDVSRFLDELRVDRIDLMKINIEGGEYRLLKRMIEKGITERCGDIQVQFHEFYPNAALLRSDIRKCLEKTHFITYDYPFVWENWRRKEVVGQVPISL